MSIAGSHERKIYAHNEKDTFFYRFSGISNRTGHGKVSKMAYDFYSDDKVQEKRNLICLSLFSQIQCR
jgi:hypothetical protein